MERILSSLLSLAFVIISLSIVLPAIITLQRVETEDRLDRCVTILSNAIVNNESITILSKSSDGATLYIEDYIRINITISEGKLICDVEVSPIY